MTNIIGVFSCHVSPQALLGYCQVLGCPQLPFLPRGVEGVGYSSRSPDGPSPLQYPKQAAEPERNGLTVIGSSD